MDTDTMTAGRWELAPLPDHDHGTPTPTPAASGSGPEDGDGYLSIVEAADELAGLERALEAREKVQREIVGRLDRLVRSKRIEQLEGLTPEMWLRIAQRQSGLDCWLLLTAVAVLGRMPVTWGLFRRGVLSWSQICRIVSRVRDLPSDGQRTVDRRIGASADLLDALGVDGLEHAVDRAARDVEGPERAERDEARARTDGFVHVQPKLFGGISLYGEHDDPIEAASIVNG